MLWCWLLFISSWGLSHTAVISAQHIPKGTGDVLDIKCQTAEECQKNIPNTNCSDGVCICQKGFSAETRLNITTCESNITTTVQIEDHETTTSTPVRKQKVDPKMIIIIVVLAIMFVGICVALHLFSKARFRNHRTIFNSPHPRLMHIKLGKKKKGGRRPSHSSQEVPGSRQLSICSQLSPMQSRRGSQVNQDYKRQVHSEINSANAQNSLERNPATKKDAQENSARVKDVQCSVEDTIAVETSPSPKA